MVFGLSPTGAIHEVRQRVVPRRQGFGILIS